MIPKHTLDEVRRLLVGVDSWVDPASYQASRFSYGCAPNVVPLMDLPLGSAPTHIDLLLGAAQRMRRPERYLELGVSFGKTLYCLANLFPGEDVRGVDWEAINPPLKHLLSREAPPEMDGPRSTFSFSGKRVSYFEMDAMSPASWKLLRGTRFGLIFSDAFHSGDAIRQQYELMRQYDVIDPDEFFILWDDIDYTNNPDMVQAFGDIAKDLIKSFDLRTDSAFMFEINGWIGEHEPPHNMGVVNNMGITRQSLLYDCPEGHVPIPLQPVSRIEFNPLGQRLAFLQPTGVDADGWLQKKATLRLPKGVPLRNVILTLQFFAGAQRFEVLVEGSRTLRRDSAEPECRVELGGFRGDRDVSVELRFTREWPISEADPRVRAGRLAAIDLKS